MHPSQRIYCTKSQKLKGKKIVLGITGSIAAGISPIVRAPSETLAIPF